MSNINASAATKEQILSRLLAWYKRHGRSLPWRRTSNPYHIWLSEVMLQQTQVDTVIPYYLRFLEKYPDIETLALAPLPDILKVWENMGYYRRAHCLHQAAGIIVSRYGGSLPGAWDDLIRLPGIGAYTAGAVLSIAFGQGVAAVDGNVRRVVCRLFAIVHDPGRPEVRKRIQAVAQSLVPSGKRAGHFNQAMMDLGASVCTSNAPRCTRCPIRQECRAYDRGLQNVLPVKTKKRAVPERHGVAAVLFDRSGRVLVVQRPAQGMLASLWKFPGGFIEPHESLEAGIRRTVEEELGIRIRTESPVEIIKHTYTHFRLRLHVWLCRYSGEAVQALKCQQWQWAAPNRLHRLPFSKADRMVLSMLSGPSAEAVFTSARKHQPSVDLS